MTYFSEKENSCRVDIFKPSGKWYETISISMEYNSSSIHESVREGIKQKIGNAHSGKTAVCTEPYHQYAHPVLIILE